MISSLIHVPVRLLTYRSDGFCGDARRTSSRKGARTASIIPLWKACEVCSRRTSISSTTSASSNARTASVGPETTHVSAADPYCPDLRALLVETAGELGIKARDGGTVVVIQGPRFSTRAESKWFQDAGWDTINMTAYPEGYLARELELCYANISMVTDHDVGVAGAEPVSHEQVVTVFEENNEKLRELLFAVIPKIGPQPEDVCATALQGARI